MGIEILQQPIKSILISTSIVYVYVFKTLQTKWIRSCVRAWQTMPENGARCLRCCIHFYVRSLLPLERCASIVRDRENLNIPDWGLCRLAPILVHIDEFRACPCLAFWEWRARTSRCPGCRPSNSCLGKTEPVGQQLWICPLLPCLQRHTFHIIIFILIFDIGKPSQLTNNAKFS